MQFTDKQQRIIADTTDAEYKLQLFQSMTPDEMSMILNLNSIPAEEKLVFFNSLSPEQKVAILTCDATPGTGILDLWNSLSAEDKQSLIEADPSGALAQLDKYNKTPVKDKKSDITADNSDAIKKTTTTNQKYNTIPNVLNTSINAKDNASSVVDKVNKKEIEDKTFTITGVFKTIGNAVSNFFGGKGGKSTPANQGRAISYAPTSLESGSFNQTRGFVSEALNSRLRTVESEKAAYNEALGEGVSSPVVSQVNSKFDSEINRLSETTRRVSDGYYKTFEELISDAVILSVLGSTANLGFGQMLKSNDFSRVTKAVNDYVKNMPDMTNKMSSVAKYAPSTNIDNSSIHFDSPLVVIEGNASNDTVQSLENMSDKLMKKIVKEIEHMQNKTKRLEGRS